MKFAAFLAAFFVPVTFARTISPPDTTNLIRPDPDKRVPRDTNVAFGFAQPTETIYGLVQNVTLWYTQPDSSTVQEGSYGSPYLNPDGSFRFMGYTSSQCRTFSGSSMTRDVTVLQAGVYTFFWKIVYIMSADPTHANSSYCGPEPFSRQSWQLISTLNVLDTSLGGGVAPTTTARRRRANSYYNPPGNSCTQCCCCIIANPGTRNFCASNSGGGWQATVPNCDYMRLHPDIVSSNFGADGRFMDSNTVQGTLLIWLIMDPAYGCVQDIATVTLAQSTSPTTSSIMTNSQVNPVSTQPAGSGGGNGGLTRGDKIALGVGIGFGLPAAFCTIWQMWRFSKQPITQG